MNDIFTKIVTDHKTEARAFVEWYGSRYNDLEHFIQQPFEKQLGVFLVYFEEKLNYTIGADQTGYRVFYANGNLIPKSISSSFKNPMDLIIYSDEDMNINSQYPVMHWFGKAVLRCFDKLDYPF